MEKIQNPTENQDLTEKIKTDLVAYGSEVSKNLMNVQRNSFKNEQMKRHKLLINLKEDLEGIIKIMEKRVSEKDGIGFFSTLDIYRMLYLAYLNLYQQMYNVDETTARKSIEPICKRKESALINAYIKRIN